LLDRPIIVVVEDGRLGTTESAHHGVALNSSPPLAILPIIDPQTATFLATAATDQIDDLDVAENHHDRRDSGC
jgi:hypothetical protein